MLFVTEAVPPFSALDVAVAEDGPAPVENSLILNHLLTVRAPKFQNSTI